ncbi:efflux RND transporter periplasmic adaptor subunit [Thauera sp. WH-1]|uniref:efflux RND transporter periplasmic adaptor subunit n=1 Tax=Thauera sp. WH-1 TaxID=3398230 RepID=UPI0039FC7FA1
MRILTVLLLLLPILAPAGVGAAQWTQRPLADIAWYPEFRAPAAVHAREEARLAAEVSAPIIAMPAREGETVARGAELVRLDAAAYRIEVERARAQRDLVDSRIRLARAQLEQARALAGRGFISADGLRIRETEVGVLESERAAAAAALAAAELALARCVIRAPFAGVVRERLASVGDLATAGMALLSFAASADAEVRARVPAAQVDSLRAAVELQLVAGEAVQALTLRRVSPVLEAAGQAREVILDGGAALPPGLAGELRWRSSVPHLPPGYVQQHEGMLGAWVARDGVAVFVPLPQAQAGRAVAVDWPPTTAVIDEGRFALGLGSAGTPEGAGGGAQ